VAEGESSTTAPSGPATTEESDGKEAAKEAKEEAEAKEVASELPDVPKSDPDGEGHLDKKQKQSE
jgi:hypothetical protein